GLAQASGNGMPCEGGGTSSRPIYDARYQFVIAHTRSRGGGGKARVGGNSGIRVDLQNERLALRRHAKIDPRIAGEFEQFPASNAGLSHFRGEQGFFGFDIEMSHGPD